MHHIKEATCSHATVSLWIFNNTQSLKAIPCSNSYICNVVGLHIWNDHYMCNRSVKYKSKYSLLWLTQLFKQAIVKRLGVNGRLHTCMCVHVCVAICGVPQWDVSLTVHFVTLQSSKCMKLFISVGKTRVHRILWEKQTFMETLWVISHFPIILPDLQPFVWLYLGQLVDNKAIVT